MAYLFATASSQWLSNTSPVLTAVPITMACWFQRVSTGAAHGLMSLQSGVGVGDNRFTLAVLATDKLNAVARSTSSGAAAGATTITSNVWHHGAGTFTSATARAVFLNGVSDGTNTTSITPAAPTNTEIGRFGSGGNFWDGHIAEAAMWSAILDAGEIAALAKGFSPLLIRPQSLEAYWPLIGRNSPAHDSLGGFPLTLNAAPVASAHPRVFYPQRGKMRRFTTAVAGATIPIFDHHYRMQRAG